MTVHADSAPATQQVERVVRCPFQIVVDSREQRPYAFDCMRAGAPRYERLVVETVRAALSVGDYSVFGLPSVVVERKSKEDLFGSVARRENFIGRLERMGDPSLYAYAAVVVESEYFDLLNNPPRHSKLRPKSLSHTLIAWRQRYRGVDWYFMPGREAGERVTFRILERFYLDHRDQLQNVDTTDGAAHNEVTG